MRRTSPATLIVFVSLACFVAACQGPATRPERSARDAALARVTKGNELFEEKCRTTAGAKIYRTVTDVRGIVLLKLRPERSDRELSDRMWPGAAFAQESTRDWYIKTFLGFEYAPGDGLTGKPGVITDRHRGYIATDRRLGGRPGYQYVDVVEEGAHVRNRYTLVERPREVGYYWSGTSLRRHLRRLRYSRRAFARSSKQHSSCR